MKKWEKALQQELKKEFREAFPSPVPDAPPAAVEEVRVRKSPVKWLAPALAAAFVFCLVLPLLLRQTGLPVVQPPASEQSVPGDSTSVPSPSSSGSTSNPNASAVEIPSGPVPESNPNLGIETVTLTQAQAALGLELKEPAGCTLRSLVLYRKMQGVCYTLELDGQEIGAVTIGKGEKAIDTSNYQPVESSRYPFYTGYDSQQLAWTNTGILLNWKGVHYHGVFHGLTEAQMLSIMESLIVS